MKAVAVAQPRHDLRHEELREWTGDDFDPRPFRSMTSTGDSHPCSATGQKTRTPEPSSSSAQLGYAGLPKAHTSSSPPSSLKVRLGPPPVVNVTLSSAEPTSSSNLSPSSRLISRARPSSNSARAATPLD